MNRTGIHYATSKLFSDRLKEAYFKKFLGHPELLETIEVDISPIYFGGDGNNFGIKVRVLSAYYGFGGIKLRCWIPIESLPYLRDFIIKEAGYIPIILFDVE